MITELNSHRADATEFKSLVAAIDEMILWLGKYQEEALNTDSILLATVLNPRFRVKFFSIHYPEFELEANSEIERAFNCVLLETEHQEPSPSADDANAADDETDDFDIFGTSNNPTDTSTSTSELQEYLQGKHKLKKDQTALDWWRVCLNFIEYQSIVNLADASIYFLS